MKRVLLVGGFHKARSLADSLIQKGYQVTIINKSDQDCKALAQMDSVSVIYGDGTKPYVLEDANAQDMDIAIALSPRDDDNLVICQLCKMKYGIKKTVSLLSDSRKTEFFRSMGVDSVVCAINAVAGIIEQQAFMDEITTLIPIGEGNIIIAEVPISSSSPVVEKKLWEIDLPKDVIIGCILRNEQGLIPRGDTRILVGDMLVLISSAKQQSAAIRILTGR